MEESHMVYGRFIVEKDDLPSGYLISLDQSKALSWDGGKEVSKQSDEANGSGSANPFNVIMLQFVQSMNSYASTVPFILSMGPVLEKLHLNETLRSYFIQNGTRIGSDDIEAYGLPIGLLSTVTARAEKVSEIRKGMMQMPSMFLMGLVSAYDVFR